MLPVLNFNLTGKMSLHIRPTKFEDIYEIMQWVNEAEVLATFANFKKVTLEQEAEFLLQLLKSKNDFTYTLEYEGQYAGQVSINKIYWPSLNGRLALFIKKEFRNKGLGKEALQLIIEKGFQELKLHKLWLLVREDNLKAQKLYKESGFEQEAILIDEYIDPKSKKFIHMIRMYRLHQTFANRLL